MALVFMAFSLAFHIGFGYVVRQVERVVVLEQSEQAL